MAKKLCCGQKALLLGAALGGIYWWRNRSVAGVGRIGKHINYKMEWFLEEARAGDYGRAKRLENELSSSEERSMSEWKEIIDLLRNETPSVLAILLNFKTPGLWYAASKLLDSVAFSVEKTEEKISTIWRNTHVDYRGRTNKEYWPEEKEGLPTVMYYNTKKGTVLGTIAKMPDNLFVEAYVDAKKKERRSAVNKYMNRK